MVSPNDIIHDPIDSGRCVAYIVMFTSSYLVLHLIIGHLARKEFNPYSSRPFQVTILAILGFIILCFTSPALAKEYEIYCLYTIAGYLLVNSLLVFRSTVKQMETHLGIKAFSITPKVKAN